MYTYRSVRGAILIFKNGEFIASADTMEEAWREVEEDKFKEEE